VVELQQIGAQVGEKAVNPASRVKVTLDRKPGRKSKSGKCGYCKRIEGHSAKCPRNEGSEKTEKSGRVLSKTDLREKILAKAAAKNGKLCRECKEIKPYVREGGICRDCKNDLNRPIVEEPEED
jgi:hypothetical protein